MTFVNQPPVFTILFHTSVTTRLRRTTLFPRLILHIKNTVHIYKYWPTSLPVNKVTPRYSTSHLHPTAHVHMHIVCFSFVCLSVIVIFIFYFSCCI